MKINNIQKFLERIPSSIYLAIAVLVFASSNSVTRKIVAIGKQNLIDGRNPISLCNVLFVGNICAFGLMALIFHQDWKIKNLKAISLNNWISLTIMGVLSGAIAPALIFTALEQTNVTNIVLIGRIEPILTLILNVCLLGASVNIWTIVGSFLSFAGVVVTALLTASNSKMMMMGGFAIGTGEILVAIAAVIVSISTIVSKLQLRAIPLGIMTLYRNALGTVIFFILANVLYGVEHFQDTFSPLLWQWMLIYAAVIVVTGQICWLAGLKNATSTELNLASLFNPIIAIIMAYLILAEVPTQAQYLGGSLLLIGFIFSFIGNRYQTKISRELKKPNLPEAEEMMGGFRGV
jgi:drug/metabolite transporter (DMT)-like permease